MSSNVPFTEFLAQYGQFNSAIRSHVAIADARLEVRSSLTETTRVAFLEIISRANIQNSHQPVWVRVDRTAERLGISTKSVSRTIKMMKKKGWLVPSKTHDGRNKHGEFDGREYLLTPAMRRLMSLPEACRQTDASDSKGDGEGTVSPLPATQANPEIVVKSAHQLPFKQAAVPVSQAATLPAGSNLSKALAIVQRRATEEQAKKAAHAVLAPQVVPDEPVENPVDKPVLPSVFEGGNAAKQTDLSHGVIYEVNKVFSLKEASVPKEAFFEKPEPRKPPKIPADLCSMQEELEIRPEGICALMKLAREMGHRLQDIWKVKREQLLNSGAKQGRAVKYIRFLLTCGEDFSYLARVKVPDLSATSGASVPRGASNAVARPTSAPAPAAVEAQVCAASTAVVQLLEIAKATRFKRFRHITNGMVVRFYDGVAEVTRGIERTVVAGWGNLEGFYVGVSRGNLVAVTE